jgi:hypothetical protein
VRKVMERLAREEQTVKSLRTVQEERAEGI